MAKMYDITIIGGGPAGMFAAFYCGLHELNAQLIESLPQLGGQVNALYPEKQIWDVAGLPGATGHELVSQLQKQLEAAGVGICHVFKRIQRLDLSRARDQQRKRKHWLAVHVYKL